MNNSRFCKKTLTFFIASIVIGCSLQNISSANTPCSQDAMNAIVNTDYLITQTSNQLQNIYYLGCKGSSSCEQNKISLENTLISLQNDRSELEKIYYECMNLESQSNQANNLQESNNQSADDLFMQGYDAFEKGDYLNAIKYLKGYLDYYPDKEFIKEGIQISYLNQAKIYFEKKDNENGKNYALEVEKYLINTHSSNIHVGSAFLSILLNLGWNNEYYEKSLYYYSKAKLLAKDYDESEGVKELIDLLEQRKYAQDKLEEAKKLASEKKDTTTKAISGNTLDVALSWMFKNGLTKYNIVQDFMPDNPITREQASKFFTQYGILIGLSRKENECVFKDLANADASLTHFISEACKYNMFKGSNGFFYPFKNISKAEAITVMVRTIIGIQDETSDPRYMTYYTKAKEWGITDSSINELDESITRGEMGLLIYNASQLSHK